MGGGDMFLTRVRMNGIKATAINVAVVPWLLLHGIQPGVFIIESAFVMGS